MYHNSSQKRHWTFASEEQLARLRADANRKFKCKAVANGKVRTPAAAGPPPASRFQEAPCTAPPLLAPRARVHLVNQQASALPDAGGTETDAIP